MLRLSAKIAFLVLSYIPMLDIQLLRKDAALVAERLAARGFAFDAARFDALEAERKTIQTRTQDAQSRRNTLSKQIGMMKGKGEDTTAVMAEVAGLGDELKQLETRLAALQTEINDFLMGVPNLPHESVALGKDETANVEVSRWGTPKTFDFPVRDHVDLGEGLGQLDFAAAVKITGSRFSVMKGGAGAAAPGARPVHARRAYDGTRLHRSLCAVSGERRFDARHRAVAEVRGRPVPRPAHRMPDKLYLIPTAEVPVTNLLRDEIVAAEALPLKFVAHTPCFRSEAGSYGRDTRGMIRQHQFDKVELVQMVRPEDSYAALEALTATRRDDPAEARPAVPQDGPVQRRHGLFGGQDLRPRSVAAGAEHLPRDFLLLQFRGLPGAPHAGAFQGGAGQAGTAAHAERFGPGGGAHAGGDPGELPERRRQRDRAGSAAAVDGRRGTELDASPEPGQPGAASVSSLRPRLISGLYSDSSRSRMS